jgi:hypothetical protein
VSIGVTVALLILAVVAGSVLTYMLSRRAFYRGIAELQKTTNRELSSLANIVNRIEAQVAELRKVVPAQPGSVQKLEATSALAGAVTAGEQHENRKVEEITPDTLVVLSAAVTAFLGKKVRIRSAKMLQSPYEIVNPWSQQGRVIVQASHSLRSRS